MKKETFKKQVTEPSESAEHMKPSSMIENEPSIDLGKEEIKEHFKMKIVK